MNEERFWNLVQAAFDRREDPLGDDRIAEALFDHPEWASSFSQMRRGVERCEREPVDVSRSASVRRPGALQMVSRIIAAASIAWFALSLIRIPPVVVHADKAHTVAAESVFRVHTLVSQTATVRVNEVVEHAEAVRDGRVVSWSSTRYRDPNGASVGAWTLSEVVHAR